MKTPLEIAQEILEDLTDRRGLRQAWEEIDDDIRDEILTRWVSIISEGISGDPSSNEAKDNNG